MSAATQQNLWRGAATILFSLFIGLCVYYVERNDEHWRINEERWFALEAYKSTNAVGIETRLARIEFQQENIIKRLEALK